MYRIQYVVKLFIIRTGLLLSSGLQRRWHRCAYVTYVEFYIKYKMIFPTHKTITRQHINLSRPSDAYIRHQPKLSLLQMMACRLPGDKPLSEPMLYYCQLNPRNIIQSNSKFKHFHQRKCIWICRLEKYRPFCLGLNVLNAERLSRDLAEKIRNTLGSVLLRTYLDAKNLHRNSIIRHVIATNIAANIQIITMMS